MKKKYLVFLLIFSFSSLLFASFNDGIMALNNKDYKKAYDEFLPEAEAGNTKAETYIAIFYYRGLGVPKDYKKAFYWFNKAALESNSGEALNNLGLVYQNGIGTDINYEEALKLYQKANDATSIYNMAVMYYKGLGTAKDYKKAFDLFLISAKRNNVNAQKTLGIIYYFGLPNIVQPNYREAVKWTEKAAELGSAGAQNNLGNIYYDGKAIKKDYVEAYKWYYIAYHNGNSSTKTGLNILSGKMKKEDIDKAIKLADEWMRSHEEIDSKLTSVDSGLTLSN